MKTKKYIVFFPEISVYIKYMKEMLLILVQDFLSDLLSHLVAKLTRRNQKESYCEGFSVLEIH